MQTFMNTDRKMSIIYKELVVNSLFVFNKSDCFSVFKRNWKAVRANDDGTEDDEAHPTIIKNGKDLNVSLFCKGFKQLSPMTYRLTHKDETLITT